MHPTVIIPIAVGLAACPFLGINPLKVAAGLAVLWAALFAMSVF